MGIVRLTNIDSTMPNLALMKLAHFHNAHGDKVYFYNEVRRSLFEPDYDVVYGSTIFTYTTERTALFLANFPEAIIGGTGSGQIYTVEQIIACPEYENYDYSIYPNYKWSIGYTQRGCRFKCKFCVVPEKEGNVQSTNTIHDIWRKGTEKNIHLIDNDFFGQEVWEDRCNEILNGNFKICLDQGINFRVLTDKQIDYIAKIDFRNKTFKRKQIYTAWDRKSHEKIFMDGLHRAFNAGIKRSSLFVYVLIGFEPETDAEIEYRINQLVKEKITVYPMIFNNRSNPDYPRLRLFRNWALTKACYTISFGRFMEQGGDTISNKSFEERSQWTLPISQS